MALKMNIRVRDFIGNYSLMIVALGKLEIPTVFSMW